MTEANEKRAESTMKAVCDAFQQELSLHGYGFQFSVLKEAQRLAQLERSKWLFSVSEFPVEVRGTSTKIDFILFRQPAPWLRVYMICECKRANPAISHWCFVRAPFVARNYSQASDPLVFDSVTRTSSGIFRAYGGTDNMTPDGYHLALPIRTGQKGDEHPVRQSRNDIEDAASQVFRGVNGYIERLASDPQFIQAGDKDSLVRIVPVIFTTAQLFASSADLSGADLETGRVNIAKGKFQRVSWLWYQYIVSPGLKHTREAVEKANALEKYFQSEYIRSVAVVNPSGIEDFLTSMVELC